MTKNLLPKEGTAYFYSNFFSPEESARFFKVLEKEIEWAHEPIIIFGKKVMQPRLTAWYGDNMNDYSYSGITMKAHPWTPTLLEIKKKIEAEANVKFTGALLNFYRDEKDSMGWHQDDEKELGKNPIIGSVSFGATRTFKFQNIKKKEEQIAIDLTDGSFLLMSGETQHCWKHSIPKRTRPLGPRINITFRVIFLNQH